MTDQAAATLKLDNLLQQPETKIEALPTGGVKVGDNRTWLRRAYDSWVIRFQAVTVFFCGLWIMIPQETIMAVIPDGYLPYGVIAYALVNALVRMRNL